MSAMTSRRKPAIFSNSDETFNPSPHRDPTIWQDADELRWAVRHWAARMNVTLRSIHLRSMTNKWASISTAGRLTLNSELVLLPRDLGEFVIIHELVHLLCPQSRHSRVFKSFMTAYLPDWHERQERLHSRNRDVS